MIATPPSLRVELLLERLAGFCRQWGISRLEITAARLVAQASPPASFGGVSPPGRSPVGTTGEPAAGTATQRDYFSPEAREILNDLLEKHATDGELQFTLPETVAQASSPASFRTVPVRGIGDQNVPAEDSGGETPAEPAAETAALRGGQFTLPDVLKVPPISQHGNVNEIIGKFGGADQLRNGVNQLQSLLYAA